MAKLDDSAGIPGQGGSNPGKARLVKRTFIIALILLSSGFIAGGSIELGFRYQESVNSIWLLQTEMASRAAFKIQQFMQGIDKTMRTVTQTQRLVKSGLTKDFEFALINLLKIEPAITSVTALNSGGWEQYKLSRVQLALPGDSISRSDDEAFLRAKGGVTFFSPVYFVGDSEPYATIATPIERFAGEIVGVLIAEVNLKYIWDVVADIQVGQAGYAYVVTGNGELIAHPDISLVLGRKNFTHLTQVQSALAGDTGPSTTTKNLLGEKVFTSYAPIPDLRWFVLVERPAAEAYATLRASLFRSGALLFISLGMAILASLMIGYRIVRPLQTLREGVARISGGDLAHHIDVRTGDELQMLADEFNEMTAKLRESYAGLEKISHLKRFFSPQLAELIELSGDSGLMDDHRREITVVFCDLRNFTEFSSIVEPEEAMQVLREYYQAIGVLLRRYEATIEHFAGDGLMAYFNDPLPCPDPEIRSVRMAMEMQSDVKKLIVGWRKRGIKLGFGIGISSGYATLGRIGSEEEFHYAAIGSVANLASRLCDKAQSGQILIAESVYAKIENLAETKRIGDVSLKGFLKPVSVLEVLTLKDDSSTTPNQ